MEIKMADNLYEALNCIFIELIKRGYKYIARDKNGALFAYSDKPTKRGKVWRLASIDGASKDISLVSCIFTDIKWEDVEPFIIPRFNWKEVPTGTPIVYTKYNGKKCIMHFCKYDEENDKVVLYTEGGKAKYVNSYNVELASLNRESWKPQLKELVFMNKENNDE